MRCVHPAEVTIKPNETTFFVIKRSASHSYQCPLCPEKYHRELDIRDHVSQHHGENFATHSPDSPITLMPESLPPSSKRSIELVEDQPVTPKRTRIHPSSPISLTTLSPPSSVPYAISEPSSDFTLAPATPPHELSTTKPKQPPQTTRMVPKSTRQTRRRETMKTFTLKDAGIYFHSPTRLLLCIECCSAVPPNHIDTHINASCPRRIRFEGVALAAALQEVSANLTPLLPEGGLDQPIPILPIQQGWRCATPGPCCGLIFGSKTAKNAHHHEKHPQQTANFTETRCQRIYSARHLIKYVAINSIAHPDDFLPPMSSWRDLKKQMQDQGALTLEDHRFVSHTQLTPLENVTKWHLALQGAHVPLARSYSRPPAPELAPSNHHRIFDAFKYYVVHIVAPVLQQRSNTMLLRLINSPDKANCERYPFRLPQNQKTVRDYAHIFSSMMTFTVRAAEKAIPGFPVTMTDAQEYLIRQFLNSDIPEDLVHAPTPFWDLVHQLCWSILTSIPVSKDFNELDIPLTRFLIAYHLRDDTSDRFKAATHICHNMIAIQWCWRAMALYQCKKLATSKDNGEIGVYDDVSQYLTEGGHTPFAVLRSHIHPITAISMQEPSLPLFLMGPDMETFSFKSHPFTMSSFKEFAVALVVSSESLILSILDGLDIADLDLRIHAALSLDKSDGWFHDTLREEEPGYSFISDQRNGLAKYEDVLMDHMCRPTSNMYAVHTPEGIQFKPNALLSFLDDVDDLVEHVYAALTFTWAGAARGTEIEDIRFRNGHSPRNLYFTNGVLTFVTFYNKTQHNTGRKSMIPRAVPPRLARLFILLLAVVYPCAKYIARIQSSEAHAVLYHSSIFVHRARPLNTERMTEILRRFTQASFIFPLGIRDCRHLMKFVLRHAVGVSLQDDPGDTPSLYRVLDGLWGHSSKVSQTYYAVEEDTFAHIDAKDVTKAQIFSLAYHEWLGIGYEHLPANLRIANAEPANALTPVPTGKIDTSAFVQSLHTTIPILGDALQATVFDAVHTYMAMHAIQPSPPSLHSLRVHPSSRVIVHPSRKDALERLYGTPEPRFTSPQQAELFELVMQNTRHILGILPTGGGKSLMFYGPPLMETEGITIVVSPFVALANQQYREAKRYGIDVVQWPSSNIDCSTVRLLVVNAEHLVHGQLDNWLIAASNHGLIRRIIFDEAHEILVSSHYRDCYSKVRSLMDLGVTIVFLTATIYRSSIPSLAKAFNIENLEVIAAPTIRTNIRYQVDTYSDERLILEYLIEGYREAVQNATPRARFLVYCRSYDECDRVAAALRLPVHKSKYTDDPVADAVTRNRVEQDWLTGVNQGVVATTGFGTGINYPYVTHVFVLNPYDMVSVTQQTGRLGRTGEITFARIFGYAPRYRKPPPDTGLDHAGKRQLHQLFKTNTCRRISIGSFDDESHSCHSVPSCTLCDYCENLVNLPPVPPRYTYPIRDTRSSREQVTSESADHITRESGVQITRESSDHVTGSNSMIFAKSKRPNDNAYPDIADDYPHPPPALTFFDQHVLRSATPPLQSTFQPLGHHDALAFNKEAADVQRHLDNKRSDSLERLIKMRARCLTCQVFGRAPCGPDEPFRCPVGIYGHRNQYTVNDELLTTLYNDVYKNGLKKFQPISRICWICYFPFSYKTHNKDDDICRAQKDILSPIAWALFCLPIVLAAPAAQALQDKLLNVAGITTPIFQSLETYSQWLPQPHPTVKQSANIVELCIAFEKLYESKDWP
ncbi:hypothetical protein EYR40_008286 [Pleurotus pulmonarius]|nr:hypothetical protein EYR36_009108 [Pleurotus pulmonarius]KAF4597819.1 hypothetical protein EYR40_008286 [Pleurotus pulmonarius]